MMMLAGAVDLDSVVGELRSVRSVFHSEADFQHAFAWALHTLDRSLHVRLEVRQADTQYVDLLSFGPQGCTAVEFKYFTAAWEGTDPATGEPFQLRNHAATDVARRDFVFDIARLERFCGDSRRPMNGLAIMLTNDRALWNDAPTLRPTRDQEFRIHDGRTLAGTLRWGHSDSYYAANERELSGTYPLAWRPYAELNGRNSTFRWLAVPVDNNATQRCRVPRQLASRQGRDLRVDRRSGWRPGHRWASPRLLTTGVCAW